MRLFLIVASLAFALSAQAQVVAQVGERPISREAFELEWNLFVRNVLQGQGLPDAPELREALAPYRKPFLESLARKVQVVLEAERLGLAPTQTRVEAEVESLRKDFPSEEEFLSALKEAGLTPEDYGRLVYEALAYQAWRGRMEERLQVSPAALRLLYLLDPAYLQPTRYCSAHILVATLEEAKAALAELQAGRPFAEVARARSLDPGSKEEGGSLGCEPLGTFIPAFENALLRLKPGEVSAPVRSEFGYHLILLEKVEPKGRLPWEAVAGDLEAALKERALDKLIDALSKRHPVQLFPENL
ncbi:peptidylprolyl isomerase [Thermus filiformis]|uniref:PpiC domain-containing protein n=1 Tax=Thermus filiformis TaxID=276 RepID=A0A0A2XC81_THEFI|nr:peptidylprolyl isomerase [Thermus filiformis]KGQ22774.1 hypothetical protein THFILI_07135 [Thermus filiformis]